MNRIFSKILIFGLCCCIFCAVGCGQNEKDLSVNEHTATKLDVTSNVSSPFYAGYFSDINTFDIQDVTLTFYYGNNVGGKPGIDEALELDGNRMVSVFFWQEKQDQKNEFTKTLVATLNETEFYTLEYAMVYNAKTGQREPAHKEKLTVPDYYFTQEFGHIGFTVATEENESGSMAGGIGIYYQRKGNNVILFKNWGVWINQRHSI